MSIQYLNSRYFLKRIFLLISALFIFVSASGQTRVSFKSSDAALVNAFNWAKETALSYKRNSNDPVGAWYEAALPGRHAFCIRDVSHQCIGAEILGLSHENKNMFFKFVSNISKTKNWCSYWEINKWNKPAPADYKSSSAFWYNLDANFDLIYACWRLYQWTGNKYYISNPVFVRFFNESLNNYIKDWRLEAGSLLTRPAMPNEPKHFPKKSNYNRSRGLPSYIESFPHVKMSSDLISAIYQGFTSYVSILKEEGDSVGIQYYSHKANNYKKELNTTWWNSKSHAFYNIYSDDGKFYRVKGAGVFMLWFHAIRSQAKRYSTIHNIISAKLNVETMSYLPYLLCLNDRGDLARRFILHLCNPATSRRTYPEVSFGVIEGIVQGLMGIKPEANSRTICTLDRDDDTIILKINNLNILNSMVSIQHLGSNKTIFQNNGDKNLYWKVEFQGRHSTILSKGKNLKAKFGKDLNGNIYSFIRVVVHPGQKISAFVTRSETNN